MTSPIDGGILGRRYNRTLHGRSRYRVADVPHHNVVRLYRSPGQNDALDIFVRAGTPVKAIHGGAVTRVVEPDGRMGCVYVQLGRSITVYAHLHVKPNIKVGVTVKEGQTIGYVGKVLDDPHLHLEMAPEGRPCVGRTPAALAQAMDDAINAQ